MMLSTFTLLVTLVVSAVLWDLYVRPHSRLARLPVSAPLAGPAGTARVRPPDRDRE